MSEKDVGAILGQVKLRYDKAEAFFWAGECDRADEQISQLSDMLADIYSSPDEKLIEPDPSLGR